MTTDGNGHDRHGEGQHGEGQHGEGQHGEDRRGQDQHGQDPQRAPRRGQPLQPGADRLQPDPVHHAVGSRRIGIRELRQHASVYVDLVERGHTVDITNRGRLVAQMVPVKEPDSPLERWIAAGVIERADEPGSPLQIDPYPALPPGRATASDVLGRIREADRS